MEVSDEVVCMSIANYMTVYGAAATIGGNYIFTVSDIANVFNIDYEFVYAHSDDILNEINIEIVSEYDFYKDDGEYIFDLTFFGNYCNVDMEDD